MPDRQIIVRREIPLPISYRSYDVRAGFEEPSNVQPGWADFEREQP
jgi:hypothetical protein